jgi:YhcH/YjgK/YiaL family protein
MESMMILDTLENSARYAGLKTGLSEAFYFLTQPGLAELPDGKHEIDGNHVYAIVAHENGRNVADGKLEGHRKYLDIQYVISGGESMGWSPRSGLDHSTAYDEKQDFELFKGDPECIVCVPPGSFTIFFPSDAHLPLIGNGPIHKVVIKVAMD